MHGNLAVGLSFGWWVDKHNRHHAHPNTEDKVLTSRNVRGNWLVDFALGGLNYQIEHHLFPSMPPPNLRHSQAIVKAFCEQHDVPYYETTPVALPTPSDRPPP